MQQRMWGRCQLQRRHWQCCLWWRVCLVSQGERQTQRGKSMQSKQQGQSATSPKPCNSSMWEEETQALIDTQKGKVIKVKKASSLITCNVDQKGKLCIFWALFLGWFWLQGMARDHWTESCYMEDLPFGIHQHRTSWRTFGHGKMAWWWVCLFVWILRLKQQQ